MFRDTNKKKLFKKNQVIITSFAEVCSINRKWTRQPKFKFWMKLFVFYFAIIPMERH